METEQNVKPEPTPEVKPTLLEETRAVVEELKKANAERRELIEREERIKANEMLGGKSDAGKPPEPPKEETAQEYAARILKGRI